MFFKAKTFSQRQVNPGFTKNQMFPNAFNFLSTLFFHKFWSGRPSTMLQKLPKCEVEVHNTRFICHSILHENNFGKI